MSHLRSCRWGRGLRRAWLGVHPGGMPGAGLLGCCAGACVLLFHGRLLVCACGGCSVGNDDGLVKSRDEEECKPLKSLARMHKPPSHTKDAKKASCPLLPHKQGSGPQATLRGGAQSINRDSLSMAVSP